MIKPWIGKLIEKNHFRLSDQEVPIKTRFITQIIQVSGQFCFELLSSLLTINPSYFGVLQFKSFRKAKPEGMTQSITAVVSDKKFQIDAVFTADCVNKFER